MDIKTKMTNGYSEKNKKDDIFLKKHVGLIHCENKLTLIQRKICNILLFNALDNLIDQDIHEISLRQLCSLVGYNSHDIKLIKEAIKGLISVVMEWNLLEDNKFLHDENYPNEVTTWNASSLLAGASIKNGLIRYSYSPQIKSILSSLDIYGRINLFVQAKFNSNYSLVLYENCVRFKNIQQTAWFSIDLFRSLMGVSNNKYQSFKEFKRNVINIAVKEINLRSDIHIEPKYKKLGRTIVGIQFLLSENENYKPTFKKLKQPEKSSLIDQSNLINILKADFSLSENQAKKIILNYSTVFLLEKINLVKNKENIEHPGAYLLSALKNDYQKVDKKVKISQNRMTENSYLREAKEASQIVSLKNKYMTYKLKVFNEYIKKQAEDIQLTIRKKFEEILISNAEVFRRYKKSGLSSPFVIADYINFVEKHFPNIIGNYLSFDDYITSEEV